MTLSYTSYEEAYDKFGWDGCWEFFDGTREDFNIAHECLNRHKDNQTGFRIKFSTGETAIHSIRDVREGAAQFAHALEDRGVEKGDIVSVMLDPCLELYQILFGIWKRGAIALPLYTLFGSDDIRYRLEDSGPELLITNDEKVNDVPSNLSVELMVDEELSPILGNYNSTYASNTEADDDAFIIYTSGTTGEPSRHYFPHKILINYPPLLKWGVGLRPDDRFFNSASPAWIQGILMSVTTPLMMGNGISTYSGKFKEDVFAAGLEEFKITNTYMVPTLLRKLAKFDVANKYDLKVDRITSAGGNLDPNTQQYFEEKLGASVANQYGSTEHGTVIMDYNGFEDWGKKTGSIGKPFPGYDVAILDGDGSKLKTNEIGEIATRVKGYDEWERTGDAGLVDEDGYFWHKGRTDDVIITAGYRISPFEIEEKLVEHPKVMESAVVGKPDEERGNIVKAFVKSQSNIEQKPLMGELKDLVKSDLSKHKYPKEFEFVDEFPKTESGKIKRNELREQESESVE